METALPPARQIWAFLLLLLSISSVCRTQSIPFLSECQSGEAPVFLLQHNSSLAGTTPLRSVTVNGGFLECTELCSAANGGGPEPFSLESSLHFVLPIAADDDDAVASPPPTPLFTRFRPSALLAQLVRAATAELLSNASSGHSKPLTASALANCTELTELIADLQDCIGVRYTAADSQCQLLGRTQGTEQQQQSAAAAAAAEGGRLVTKSCVKSKRICSSPFHFDVHEQKILVGFAREVVPAESAQQCLTACLDAFDTFGFECESVMFYPVDAECILNTEDRLDRPDLFVDEHEDTVIYMDNNCAGSQCYAPYVTQYVAVDGKQLADELDHTFEGMELAECEELCTQRLSVTANDFNCKAFMYNKQSRNCILSDERSRPLGRANLSDAQGWTYHEKKCFASPRTCRNVPSFTRVPQMLLVGFASFVMENVPSVTMCLDQCTNPPPETGQNFVCKSVMYYYNEQECILNAESRHSKPDLFIPEEDDFVVDYFDINCRLEPEQCTDGRMAKLVRTLNAALPEGESAIHVLETMQTGVQECAQKCVEHAPDKCRSINFDKSSGTCNLLYLDGRGSLRPETKAQVDLYDVHCLNGPKEGAANNQHSPSGCVDPEGAIFSRNLYTRWVATSPSKELASVPLSKCLNLCSTAGEQCEGVNYNRRSGGCQMFTSLGGAAVDGQQREEEEKSEHVDFYRNVCRVKEIRTEESSGAANVPKTPPPTAAPQPQTGEGQTTKGPIRNLNNRTLAVSKPTISKPAPDFRHGPVKVEETTAAKGEEESGKVKPAEEGASKQFAVPTAIESAQGQQKPNSVVNEVVSRGQVDGKLSVKNEGHDPNAMPAPVLIPASEVHTICNYEGISVQIKHSEPFSGVVFVKNKYDSCRVEVETKDSVTLVLGLPANFGMKPISLNPNPSAGHRKPKAQADATLAIGAANNGSDSSAESSAEQAAELATTAEAEAQQRKRARRQSSQRDCGLQDMDNGTYKTVVVVQTNNLGIPGLVTSMDQLYEISCNYSSMLGGKVQAAASLRVQGPQPSLIQPRGKIELGNPVLMQMSPVHRRDIGGTLQRDEGPLVQAKLGDILELRWEIMAMDEELDFFVRDCYAEPGISAPSKTAGASAAGGEANNSEKLQLIEAGCPTPAVAQKLIPNPISVLSSAVKIAHLQAFRFDSSSSVRITCHLELCKGDCKSVNCKLLDGVKESWGRKKRAAAVSPATAAAQNGVTEFETRRYKVPRFAQATTSLVIIDPLQKFSDPLMAAPFQSHSSLSRLAADLPTASVEENNGGGNSSNAPGDLWLKVMPKSASSSAGQHRGELCLHKWTVGGVLGTLMALILIQSAVVAKYMFARLFADQSK